MSVLLSRGQYDDRLAKNKQTNQQSVDNQMHLLQVEIQQHAKEQPKRKQQKRKTVVPYLIESHFITQIQYSVYEILVKKVYNLFFSCSFI